MSFTLHIGPNQRKSPYFDATVRDGVRGFAIYNHMLMPGHFGDPLGEYWRLIEGVTMWDVAAERQVELHGPDAWALARYLTPRNLEAMRIGQGYYVPICNPAGALINDPVLLPLAEDRIWLSIADSDIELWAGAIAHARGLNVAVREADASPLAIQGPKAMAVARALLGDWVSELRYFGFRETELDGIPLLVARSGWSKQGGVELYLRDASRGDELWQRVKDAGAPWEIGPGAPNDIERIESGLASYGADFRHTRNPANPFELGMERLVDLTRHDDFIGKTALQRIAREGAIRRQRGFIIDGDALPGNEHPLPILAAGAEVGLLSELVYSPRLEKNIGIGQIRRDLDPDTPLSISLGGAQRRIQPCDLPFIAPQRSR